MFSKYVVDIIPVAEFISNDMRTILYKFGCGISKMVGPKKQEF